MDDPFDDPAVKAYLLHAKTEMFPKLKDSGVSLTLLDGDPDPKLCLELGAAILFDKPIIVLLPDRDKPIPANLKRCASAVIRGDPKDPAVQKELTAAIKAVLLQDRRKPV